jgi:biotin transport system substrate-specific component
MQTAASSSRFESLSTFSVTLPGRLILGVGATLLVAVAAHVSIPLPFTPVPLTLQPLAVLGVGVAFGPLASFLTMLAYLAEGALGLPVFSPTGPGGVAQLLGPTGGFLMAYPVVAAMASGLTRSLSKWLSSFASALIAGHLAMGLLFLSGAGWLMAAPQYHLSYHQVLIAAVLPFVPGEIVKVFVAAGMYSTLVKARRIE